MTYVNYETNKADMWPNFFIVGAARAGTTTLYEYLRRVPQVYLPSFKEPRYFLARSLDQDIYGRLAIGNTENYLNLFTNSDATAIGEATPEYLYHDSAAHKIREKVPHAKIIITLRNPVNRAFSHYLLAKSILNIKYSFDDIVKEWVNNKRDLGRSRHPGIIECGFYSHGVSKYLELFGSNRTKNIIFEEWTKDAINTFNAILEFLGVNYKFDDSITIQKENASRSYSRGDVFLNSAMRKSMLLRRIYIRLPAFVHDLLKNTYHMQLSIRSSSSPPPPPNESISNETKEMIRDIYWNDVKELEKILGRRLPWQDFQR